MGPGNGSFGRFLFPKIIRRSKYAGLDLVATNPNTTVDNKKLMNIVVETTAEGNNSATPMPMSSHRTNAPANRNNSTAPRLLVNCCCQPFCFSSKGSSPNKGLSHLCHTPALLTHDLCKRTNALAQRRCSNPLFSPQEFIGRRLLEKLNPWLHHLDRYVEGLL
jgi:hypothetical protein